MKLKTVWFQSEKPHFNLELSNGVRPFLIIKKCRILKKDGKEFISYPFTKEGKQVYGSDAFNQAVMKIAKDSKPSPIRK